MPRSVQFRLHYIRSFEAAENQELRRAVIPTVWTGRPSLLTAHDGPPVQRMCHRVDRDDQLWAAAPTDKAMAPSALPENRQAAAVRREHVGTVGCEDCCRIAMSRQPHNLHYRF